MQDLKNAFLEYKKYRVICWKVHFIKSTLEYMFDKKHVKKIQEQKIHFKKIQFPIKYTFKKIFLNRHF